MMEYFHSRKEGSSPCPSEAESSTPTERFVDLIFEQMIEEGAWEIRLEYRNGIVTRTLPDGKLLDQIEPVTAVMEWLVNGSWAAIPTPPPRWMPEILSVLRRRAHMASGDSGTFAVLIRGEEWKVMVRISEDGDKGRADLRIDNPGSMGAE